MGKGKKKARGKGKKRDGIMKTNDDANACGGEKNRGPTPEQCERAREAAANRTEDPLKNWVRTNQEEECPICMLPFPSAGASGGTTAVYWFCCGKSVCGGCIIDAGEVQRKSGGDPIKAVEKLMICPFCRSSNMANYNNDKCKAKQEMKRANAGQSDSMCRVADYYFDGEMGFMRDKAEGLKWYHRASEAGSGQAAWNIGMFYYLGDGVDQDEEKALEYNQRAIELGFEPAYYSVGYILMARGEIEEAMLNYRKAAMCGADHRDLFDELRKGFSDGFITKEEYAFTLRKNQDAVNEAKTKGREKYRRILKDV